MSGPLFDSLTKQNPHPEAFRLADPHCQNVKKGRGSTVCDFAKVLRCLQFVELSSRTSFSVSFCSTTGAFSSCTYRARFDSQRTEFDILPRLEQLTSATAALDCPL